MIGGENGEFTAEFADGQKIVFSYPGFKVGGMVYGTRTVNLDATMEFNDVQCGLKAVITFGPAKKKGWFRKQQGTLDGV